MHPPRFAVAIAILASVGILVVAIGTAYIVDLKNDARDRSCERSVTARDDNRAMWLYLLEDAPDTPKTRAFVEQLNTKLPPLKCTDMGELVEDK